MQWITDPRHDSRFDTRAAQQALVHAGYPPAQARADLAAYLRRVRVALTQMPATPTLAGILTVATMAASVLLMLTLSLEVVVRRWGLGGEDFAFDYRHADAPLLPNIMPEAAFALMAFGLLGAGAALGIRRRWRRAGVLRAFRRQPPPRIAPASLPGSSRIAPAGGWTNCSGWLVADRRRPCQRGAPDHSVRSLSVEPAARHARKGAGCPGNPAWCGGFYRLVSRPLRLDLPRVSTVDAAAYARPIIERETARQVADASDFLPAQQL